MTTHSELACFRDCPRKRLLRYGYGLRPSIEPGYLTFGKAWALLHEAQPIDKLSLDPFARVALEALFEHYPFAFEYIAVEREFPANDEERRKLPLDYRGKIDAIVRLQDGRLAVLERKTAAFVDDTYWARLQFDAQVVGYFIAARAAGIDVQTVVYDVVEKPSIRPYVATPMESRKYTKKDTKNEDGSIRPAGSLYANQHEFDETPAEFQKRIVEWISLGLPYHTRELPITAQRIREWEDDYHTQLAVMNMGASWRNPSACVQWNNACDFLSVCHRTDLETETPETFRRSTTKHEELAL